MVRKISFAVLVLGWSCQGLVGGAVKEVVELKARPFSLKQVRLLEGPFKDAMERDREYLHTLDSDRMLHTFRVNASLPSDAEPLGGWEKPDCEVRGHTMGHYLSACALMYASTGDEKLKAKADAIVAELAKCQEAIGSSGYLSAFGETHIERAEAFKRVWAPYYCLHKIYAGMLDMYVHCGNAQALEVARKMAAWNKTRLDKLDRAHIQRMLNGTEQGGMNDTLANLYGLTGDADYLAMSRRFNQDRYIEPLAAGEDRLKGQHVNSFIPNIIGIARQYELGGDPRDRKIAEYFWSQVVDHRSYCTGGTSNNEHWRSDPDKLAHELGDCTQETCCTYNMLKLTRRLFTWDPKPRYGDYYERALYNSILSTQNPKTNMMMYFVPLATGRWKMYNLPYDSFWCCTATGLENHAKYGDSIYFGNDDTLFVNLFIASELDWTQKGVRIRQETDFPRGDTTTLTVRTKGPAKFEIRLRVPYWATQGVSAKLNGRTVTSEPVFLDSLPGTFAVDRTWEDGDRLEVRMPMSLHKHPMPDDEGLIAFMYGPLALAGQLGGEGLTEENTHTSQNWYKFASGVASVEPLIVESDEIDDWIKRIPGKKLAFRTAGQSREVTLVPYHELFDQRYVIYWRVLKRDGEAHEEYLEGLRKREALQARIFDSVAIGNAESEKSHNLKGSQTQSGGHAGRTWRDARGGGWFSYDLKVLPDRAVTLQCTYWGSDVGRTFDVLIDGRAIATTTLSNNKPGEFYEQQYELNPRLTRGRDKVTVMFRGSPGSMAGGVFGCAILKDDKNRAGKAADEKKAYLFTSFRGNGEDGLHLAYSFDGYRWTDLKKVFLRPEVGKSKLMRDPCIIQGPDGTFHTVWTTGWGEKGIGYAHSQDLVNWSAQKYVEVMAHEPGAKNCWAPEVFYDELKGQYLIFWATTIPGRFPETEKKGDNNHRIYYVATKDFETFSKARLFYEHGFNVIDSTIIRDKDRYLMFLKDETRNPPQKNIRLAFADAAEGPYSRPSEPITGQYWAEGPTALKIGDSWLVYFDKYRKHNYGVVISNDLENWRDVSDKLEFPEGSRHGTVLPISKGVLQKLIDAK